MHTDCFAKFRSKLLLSFIILLFGKKNREQILSIFNIKMISRPALIIDNARIIHDRDKLSLLNLIIFIHFVHR